MTASARYEQEVSIYIRYNAPIEEKASGQKKIGGGSRPAFSKITQQIQHEMGAGKYDSLLMGREFQPGRFVILFDFDNKVECASKHGLNLVEIEHGPIQRPQTNNTFGGLTLFILRRRRSSTGPPQLTNGNHTRLRQIQHGC